MAWYRPHDVKNPGIDMVTANCGAQIARLSFNRANHLCPISRIVWFSPSNHMTAGKACDHEFRQDDYTQEPQCIGVTSHLGELAEDRVR